MKFSCIFHNKANSMSHHLPLLGYTGLKNGHTLIFENLFISHPFLLTNLYELKGVKGLKNTILQMRNVYIFGIFLFRFVSVRG